MRAATLKMTEIRTKTISGASNHASVGVFTPSMTSSGLTSLPSGPASNAPKTMPIRENATRMAPCRYPIPASDTQQRGIIGCNMAFWREDIVAVNGFDEDYTGWGTGEDSDIGTRLDHLGRRRKFLYESEAGHAA